LLGLGSVASTNTITLAQEAQSPLAELPARKAVQNNLLPERKGRESDFAAHAILIESTPAPNSSVAGPDIEIRLRFNSRIDEARSRLTLVFPDHTTYRLEIHKQAADTLTSRATGLKHGAHSLQWQVLASDGHVTRGEVPFAVG
jgi:methionine-rich copper-binding protein CopC